MPQDSFSIVSSSECCIGMIHRYTDTALSTRNRTNGMFRSISLRFAMHPFEFRFFFFFCGCNRCREMILSYPRALEPCQPRKEAIAIRALAWSRCTDRIRAGVCHSTVLRVSKRAFKVCLRPWLGQGLSEDLVSCSSLYVECSFLAQKLKRHLVLLQDPQVIPCIVSLDTVVLPLSRDSVPTSM